VAVKPALSIATNKSFLFNIVVFLIV